MEIGADVVFPMIKVINSVRGINGNNIRECSPVHPDEARIATCTLLLGLFPNWDRLTGNNATDGMEQ